MWFFWRCFAADCQMQIVAKDYLVKVQNSLSIPFTCLTLGKIPFFLLTFYLLHCFQILYSIQILCSQATVCKHRGRMIKRNWMHSLNYYYYFFFHLENLLFFFFSLFIHSIFSEILQYLPSVTRTFLSPKFHFPHFGKGLILA